MKWRSTFGILLAWISVSNAKATDWPGEAWPQASPESLGLSAARLHEARDYAAKARGSGCIIHQGKLVLSWGDPRQLYDLKSTTKSIGVTLLGVALGDKRASLEDRAIKHHPSFAVPPEQNVTNGWIEKVTLRMLARQTAGFSKPGGFEKMLFEPGTQWHYSDGGPNWLAECLTLAYKKDLKELLFERICKPLGITEADLKWRNNSYRPNQLLGLPRREFGAGISANVEAMSRIGYLYLRQGMWKAETILPREFVMLVSIVPKDPMPLPVYEHQTYGDASSHYGLLWWNNADGHLPEVPRDAYWAWGLFDSLILVVPSLDLVAVRAGNAWDRTPGGDHYAPLKPFFQPLCAAVGNGLNAAR